ncbi:MAG TPA: SAM-dependent methyltransferase [Acidimicrobiales bacterium]|nr:SAM-dependent methyltransferase [Acidimicrobiales bacterium]
MTERSFTATGPDRDPVTIDSEVAHTSRIYDYLLGGTDNFAVDREVAQEAFSQYPGGLDGARADARANRAFLQRAVRFLAEEAGVRQFLDVGTGIPTAGNIHSIAQQVAPGSRIVYVDNDPMVLAHAHALLRGTPDGATAYVNGDLRQPAEILGQAADTLDLSQPVAIVLVGILHVIPDDDAPHKSVAALLDAVPSGSYLALSHMTSDGGGADSTRVWSHLDDRMRTTNRPAVRPVAEVARFFDGLELVEPGLVAASAWRPDASAAQNDGRPMPVFGGVARKR